MSVPSNAASQSTQTVITALVFNAAIAGIEVAIFIVVRRVFKTVYEPRSHLPDRKTKAQELPPTPWGWIPAVIFANPRSIIRTNGLDAYLFIRYLRLMCLLFFSFTLITWPVLLPLDAVNSGGTGTGFDQFTFGNIGLATSQQNRYWGHLVLTYVITFGLLWLTKMEMKVLVEERQRFLISPEHEALPRSKTVLVTGVPREYFKPDRLEQFLKYLPGGVRRTWFARDLKHLPDLWEDRKKACGTLENAETSLLKTANKLIRKKAKSSSQSKRVSGLSSLGRQDLEKDKDLADKLVPRDKRPTHRLTKLPIPIPLVGKKVDSIDWARKEIAELNEKLDEERKDLSQFRPEKGLFIQFNQQIAAHMFAQSVAHHQPLRMSQKYLDVSPKDVIWWNLNLNPYDQKIRYAISWGFTIGLIILWSFPVAFVGAISNVNELCISAPWLRWLCNLPSPVSGIIQGVLPPAALAVLMMLLPIILRYAAIFEGIPLNSIVELSLMKRYFLFLVIHGFLIVTLASGLIAALPQIAQNPTSTVQLLASRLPRASNFFLTYLITQGLSGAAGGILRIVALLQYCVKIMRYTMPNAQWGTLFPSLTLLTAIGLAYSVISPLINGFALLAFALFWFAYKYLFIWVYDVPKVGETGGFFYYHALQHLFIGLYIQQICLCGLFFLAQNSDKSPSSIPQAALMIVLIALTAFFHVVINSGYGSLVSYLPLSLASQIGAARNAQESTRRSEESDDRAAILGRAFSQMDGSGREVIEMAEKSGARPAVDGTFEEVDVENHLETHASGPEDFSTPHSFDHPSTYERQPIIWIPKDPTGLGEQEAKVNRESNVEATTEGAKMDEKGKVQIFKSPPDDLM